jgi:glycosyltransferase involved in cell wall biosynthesis
MRVRYYGHVGRLTGYGQAGADLCMSLLAAGAELEIGVIGKPPPSEAAVALEHYDALRARLRHEHEMTTPDVVIVHTLPLDCARVVELVGCGDSPCVAYTTWEAASAMPEEVTTALGDFDQVWVPSYQAWCAMGGTPTIFDGRSDRLVIVPHAFDPATLEERRRKSFNFDLGYRFYYSGAWTSRKNPAGILRAWAMAFGKDDGPGVGLVLHCPGAHQEQFAIALHQTGLTPDQMAPVVFRTQPLSDMEYLDLHRKHDCFVTATRGEAWNLPAFDAMLAGRHVIHPIGMGADDYLEDTSAHRYGGMLAPASVDVTVTERMAGVVKLSIVGAQGLSSRSTWLEPNLVVLADAMKSAYRGRCRDLTIDYDVADRYGYPAVGKTALTALEDL